MANKELAIHPLSQLATQVAQMAPGEWRDIDSTNSFQDVRFTQAEHDALVTKTGSQPFYSQGPEAVINRWGGMAYDDSGHRLFFHGGGHYAYGGNEVYQFNLATLTWTRVTDPSPLIGDELTPGNGAPNPAPAEGPFARHTYDGLTWHPVT